MSTHGEDLALERLAVERLEAEARAAWQGRRYVEARTLARELQAAREHVRELEQEEAGQ